MSELTNSITHRLKQTSGRTYLLIAVIIFAAANSVTRKLTVLGAANLIEGRNPISFCNVLFVGNLCALCALLLVYHRQLARPVLRQLSRKDWLGLMTVAVLSGALAPAFFFSALNLTAVNNVILIGRIEPPLTLALSVLLLGARVNSWVVWGALVSFVGVVLTIVLQTPTSNMVTMAGFQVGQGELMTVAGAIAAAIAVIVSKVTLQQVPLGLFNVVRTAMGTLVFFVAALSLFGAGHFTDVFSPLLWQWMILYGAVIVVGGQLCWFAGLRTTNAAEVALANSFNPIAGVLAAYLILGEVPTLAQYLGGVVILAGIALNQVGILRETAPSPKRLAIASALQEMEAETTVGFKGI